MSALSLKEALLQDLKSLKTLDISIIPGRIYYRDLFLGWLLLFTLFLGIQSLVCLYAIQTNAWEYVPHLKSKHVLIQEIGNDFGSVWKSMDEHWELSKKFPHLTPEAIQQMVDKNNQLLKAERLRQQKKREAIVVAQLEDEHLTLVVKMFFGVLFSSFLFSLFLVGRLKLVVIFKYQFQSQLQTGDYLAQKMKLAFWSFFLVFTSLAFIVIPLFEQDVVFFSGIPCFIGAALTIGFVIYLEVSRLGIGVLFTSLNESFLRSKKVAS